MDTRMALDREPTLQDAMSTIARQAIRISQLEADNDALRAQVQAGLQSNGSNGLPGGNRQQTSTSGSSMLTIGDGERPTREPAGNTADLLERYEGLKAKYSRLESAHAECGPKLAASHQKVAEAKQRCKEWKAYHDRHMERQRLRSEEEVGTGMEKAHEAHPQIMVARRAVSRATASPRMLKGIPTSAPALLDASAFVPFHASRATASPRLMRDTPNAAEDLPNPRTAVAISSDLPSSLPRSESTTRPMRTTSSQTTVDDAAEQSSDQAEQHTEAQDDSDPVVVSARPVKRRAAGAADAEPPAQRVKIKDEPNSPDNPIALRSEDYSSPKRTPERLRRTETIDLDDAGPRMVTPRRRDFFVNQRLRASSEEAGRPVPSLTRAISSYSDGDLESLSVARPHVKVERLPEDRRAGVDTVPDVSERGGEARRPARTLPQAALQPLSVNVPTRRRTSEYSSASKSKRRRTGSRGDVALLSEAGDEESSQSKVDEVATNDNRLEDLLNERSPEKTPTFVRRPLDIAKARLKAVASPRLPTPISTVKQPSTAKKSDFQRMQSPELPTPVASAKRPSPVKRKSHAKRPAPHNEEPPPVEPDHEPLRIRRLDQLGLDDFKINPKYLGTNYAWADTLRGRDQRRNLMATRNPQLDKAIAMSGGPALSGKTDAQALEIFLGPQWEDYMGDYGPDQRKDVVTQAHVHCFTKQHGKQREAFERRVTPPGFWDTDFPTTQDAAQNRSKALEIKRKTVAERWREAIRGDGRWIFRDE